jgi:anti-sigma factor RsiW
MYFLRRQSGLPRLRFKADLGLHAGLILPSPTGGPHDNARRTRSLLRRWAAAAVIGVIAGCAAEGQLPDPNPSDAQLRLEVAGNHAIYSRETRHLIEVPAEEIDHLRMWLNDRLHGEFEVPDLAEVGLSFAGGRMLVLGAKPAAQLMYTRERGLPVGICIRETAGAASAASFETRGPLRLASWRKNGYLYVVVGELSDSEIHAIAARLVSRDRL